jgi:hypothetical protein
MAFQVIKQPDGKLAIFTTEQDRWTAWDLDPEEVVQWFADRAGADARERAQRIVNHVLEGTPWKVYFQFAMTFAEANAHSWHHGGEVLPGGVDADLLVELERPLDGDTDK